MKNALNPLPVVLYVALTLFFGSTLAIARETPSPDPAPQETPKADGWKLLDQGHADEALAAFQLILESDPGRSDLLLGAGRATLHLGDYSRAIRFLSRAIELAPEMYDAHFHRALAFAAQGRELFYGGEVNDGGMMMEDAANMFSVAAELKAGTAAPLVERAEILMELGDVEGADAAAEQALKRDARSLRALLVRGDAAFMQFQFEGSQGAAAGEVKLVWRRALEHYEAANVINTGATGPYLGMAALYEADKKWNEASEVLMKALVLDPELLQGYNRLIMLLGNAEGREKLVSLLETLVEEIENRFPGDNMRKATPYYYAGFAYFLNFEYEASIEAYTASFKCNQDFTTGAVYHIARSHFALNDHEEAARDFFRIINSDPDGFSYFLTNDRDWQNVCVALAFLSNHSYDKGSLHMARDLIGGILLVQKNSPIYYNNFAFLCRETSMYEEAYAAYREALSLEPNNPRTLNDTALILHYHLHRELDYARELYKRAIEEAQAILQSDESSQSVKEDARVALQDATTNLRRLRRGEHRGG